MKHNVYCFRDKVAEESSSPFLAKNDGIAIRNYRSMLNQGVNPSDFDLLSLGTFDSEATVLDVYEVPEQVDVGTFAPEKRGK